MLTEESPHIKTLFDEDNNLQYIQHQLKSLKPKNL